MAVYDRLEAYLKSGDYVKLASQYDPAIFIFIESEEPMGQMNIQMANGAVPVGARAARAGAGTVVPPAGFVDAQPVAFEFLEPQREDRLYQIRPTVYAIDRTTGLLVDRAIIPPLLELQWEFPRGSFRGGTDRKSTITINGVINRDIGGNDGGRIPVNQIYTATDPSEVFDIFAFFDTFPAFRLLNNTRGTVGGGGGVELDYDWYLAVQGKKFVFRSVTAEEQKKIANDELSFRGIPSPGGVPKTLLKRELPEMV